MVPGSLVSASPHDFCGHIQMDLSENRVLGSPKSTGHFVVPYENGKCMGLITQKIPYFQTHMCNLQIFFEDPVWASQRSSGLDMSCFCKLHRYPKAPSFIASGTFYI